MKQSWIGLAALVSLVFVTPVNRAAASPAPVDATAAISVDVAEILEWRANFAAIDLADITTQNATPSASASMDLYTNGDVVITADNTSAARLHSGTDNLQTEYRLQYDGNGTTATGGATVDWALYNVFTGSGSSVTHIAADGVVSVTLSARASNYTGDLGDVGAYTAVQTLTATW